MSETAFYWLILFCSGVAFIFICLIVQDLWRERRRKVAAKTRPVQVFQAIKRRWRPSLRGYDYPELLLEDMETRMESNEEANETKTQA